MMREKRVSLISLVLSEENEECMEVMAEKFQNPRSGFMQHIYWEDLEHSESETKAKRDPLEYMGDATTHAASCAVM
jgi:hypothetical protein